MERSDGEDRYRSEAALRAREVFRAFELTGETLRLRGLVSRTGLNKSTVFRLLHQSKAG
jgi:DNA-binding IclR family transcriptional regulator